MFLTKRKENKKEKQAIVGMSVKEKQCNRKEGE